MTNPSDDARQGSDLMALDFDQFQRYRSGTDLLLRLAGPDRLLRVLEVGSNVLDLLPRFLHGRLARAVRCDVQPGAADDADYVQIRPGEPLPFADGEFDFVVAIDVLEHVPAAGRRQFLAECARVAATASIVTHPRGDADVVAAERTMSSVHRMIFGTEHVFLVEHAEHGLPPRAETEGHLRSLGLDVRVFHNSPLQAWLGNCVLTALMAPHSGQQVVLDAFNREYNEVYYGAFPDSPGYRLMFVFGPAAALQGLAQPELPSPLSEEDSGSRAWIGVASIMQRFLARLRASDETSNERQRDVEQLHVRVAELERGAAAAEQRAALAEATLRAMQQAITWRVMQLPRRAVDRLRAGPAALLRVTSQVLRGAAHRLPRLANWAIRRMPHLAHRLAAASGPVRADRYREWLARHLPSRSDLQSMARLAAGWPAAPVISILTPVYNVDERWLRACIESVRRQVYPHWQLCLADDASSAPHVAAVLREYAAVDPRIVVDFRPRNGGIAAASNSALALATGEYVALLDNDDELPSNALFEVARALLADPEIDFIYTDEDKIGPDGRHCMPSFKPDWSPEHLLSTHYPCHLVTYRRRLVEQVGGFRSAFDGSQDYDLCLRVTEHCRRICHVPKVLYHWRTIAGSAAADQGAKPAAHEAARRALAEALQRRGLGDRAEASPLLGIWRARPAIRGLPLVSIVIPTAGRSGVVRGVEIDLLLHCVGSVVGASTWPNLEFVIVHNGDLRPEQIAALVRIQATIHLVEFDRPFNLSAKINLGVERARGEYCLLLNDDIEVIEPGFVEAMLEWAQETGVGAVGATLLYPDGRLQHAGVALLSGAPHHVYFGFPAPTMGHCGLLHCVRNSLAVTGACMLLRKVDYEAVGGFDPDLPLNYNDVDLCLKLQARGLRIVMTPYARLYHFEGVSKSHEGLDIELARFLERHLDFADGRRRDPYYSPNFEQRLPFYELPGVRQVGPSAPRRVGRGGQGALVDDYATWIQHRVFDRQAPEPASVRSGLLSLITSAYDTKPEYLEALARTVFRQTWPRFEWVLVDNGSTDAGTRAALATIGRDPRVRLVRVETNLGIQGGMRAAFDSATGRYVLPLDSDDLLYPDALAVMAAAIEANGHPALLYSDEDKVGDGGAPHSPFFKPDWDPVLFLNCCFIAHLCAIDREIGQQVGVYTEPEATGCTDLDTFCRFLEAGHRPVHVPEVLYTWRIHAGSTAAFQPGVKPYTVRNQQFVLQRHLTQHPRGAAFELVPNDLLPPHTTWRLRRKDRRPAPTCVALLDAAGGDCRQAASVWSARGASRVTVVATFAELAATAAAAVDAGEHLVVADPRLAAIADDWLVETTGLAEFFGDEVVGVAGRAVDAGGRIVDGGGVMGFARGLGCPERGMPRRDPGYYGLLLQQRRVGALSCRAAALRPSFLADVLAGQQGAVDLGVLESIVASCSASADRLLVLTPFAEVEVAGDSRSGPREVAVGDVPLDPAYPRHHGLQPATAYSLVWASPRQRSTAAS